MGQTGAPFEFLGYKFWRSKNSGKSRRLIRDKRVKKEKEPLKPELRCNNGKSLAGILEELKVVMRGTMNTSSKRERSR
jgi:hypothetical protein